MLDRTNYRKSYLIGCIREAVHVYCKGTLVTQVYNSLLVVAVTFLGAFCSHIDTSGTV
jgi:hypothetical protein